jgi:hypothetical protein
MVFLCFRRCPSDYHAFLSILSVPLSEGSPVPVGIDIQVESIDSISEVGMVSLFMGYLSFSERIDSVVVK